MMYHQLDLFQVLKMMEAASTSFIGQSTHMLVVGVNAEGSMSKKVQKKDMSAGIRQVRPKL